MQVSIEQLGVIVGICVTLVSVIYFFARLEGKTNNNGERIKENAEVSEDRFQQAMTAINKNELRLDRVENRHEQSSNEVRTMLMAIQKSLSTLEGKLSINSRNDDR